MKKIFKRLICAAITLCLTISVSTMTAFAIEYNRNEQIKYLSEQEKYDYIWKSFTYGQEYEINRCKENDDLLTLSIAREELKSFVSNLDISPNSSTDYTVTKASADFTKSLQEKYSNIMPYSEDVIKYMKSHPNADLQWSYDNDKDNYYTVSDYPSFECTVEYTGTYMQYSDNDVSNILIWTYDQSKDKYICKDQNGKTVNSVAKYHLEDETATSSKPSAASASESTSKHTTDYSTVSGATETASADVSENEVTAVYEDSTVSAVAETTEPDVAASTVSADNSNQTVTAESAVEQPMESSAVEVTSNNGNNVQNIILIVLGVLIVAGIVVIIVMLIKKKGNKNES